MALEKNDASFPANVSNQCGTV